MLANFTARKMNILRVAVAFLWVFVMSVCAIDAYGQSKQLDSAGLQQKLQRDSAYIFRFRKVQVLLSLDRRSTFLETAAHDNTPVHMNGLKMGLTLMERHRTGIGFYQIDRSGKQVTKVNGVKVPLDFNFSYIALFYEYYLIHTRLWDIGVPFEIGAGRYYATDVVEEKKGVLFPMGTALDVRFRPLRWMTLNVMGGYRLVANNNSPVNLNNWFYAYGVSLHTRNLYNDTRWLIKKSRYRKNRAALAD